MAKRFLIIAATALIAGDCLAEVTRKTDEKGVTFTSRVGSDIVMVAKTEDSGKIAQTLYFRGYIIATIIGWTDKAQTASPAGKLFQRRVTENYMKEGEKSLRLHYAFLRRTGSPETFQIARNGEIIDAYFVSNNNNLTPMTDAEFKKYREEREASRE